MTIYIKPIFVINVHSSIGPTQIYVAGVIVKTLQSPMRSCLYLLANYYHNDMAQVGNLINTIYKENKLEQLSDRLKIILELKHNVVISKIEFNNLPILKFHKIYKETNAT